MSDRVHVATRKGLFTVERSSAKSAASWSVSRADFIGENASISLFDPRDNSTYVALDHGHFASSCTARPMPARRGRNVACPLIPNSRPKIIGNRKSRAKSVPAAIFRRCRKYGNSRRAGLINPGCSGQARFRAVCSVRPIEATLGS